MRNEQQYWFPAKRNGFGWSLPTVWQGYATVAIYLLALTAFSIITPPSKEPFVYAVGFLILTTLFVTIVWRKGEPLRWRDGQE